MMALFCLLPLLASLAYGNVLSDCAVQNSCFGTPPKCNPETNCHIYFHFDQQGNLDVNVKNITELDGYIAVEITAHPLLVSEHVICIPHSLTRLRVVSVPGKPIQVTREQMTGHVYKMYNNDFKCTFLKKELPIGFNNRTKYVVSEGIFTANTIIPSGTRLSPVHGDYVYNQNEAVQDNNQDLVNIPEQEKGKFDLLSRKERMVMNGDNDVKSNSDLNEEKLDSDEKFNTQNDDSDSFVNDNQMNRRSVDKYLDDNVPKGKDTYPNVHFEKDDKNKDLYSNDEKYAEDASDLLSRRQRMAENGQNDVGLDTKFNEEKRESDEEFGTGNEDSDPFNNDNQMNRRSADNYREDVVPKEKSTRRIVDSEENHKDLRSKDDEEEYVEGNDEVSDNKKNAESVGPVVFPTILIGLADVLLDI